MWRRWRRSGPTVCFVLLNPSTAATSVDDPTLRRCIGFAERWGYGALTMVNMYALRATNPSELFHAPRPIGCANGAAVSYAAHSAAEVVVGWGANGRRTGELLALLPGQTTCLGLTRSGAPRHPLYVPYEAMRIPYVHAPA